jgi:hypothetical protein
MQNIKYKYQNLFLYQENRPRIHQEKTVLSGRAMKKKKKLNQSTKPIFFIADKVEE